MELLKFGMDVNQQHYCLACPCRSNVQSYKKVQKGFEIQNRRFRMNLLLSKLKANVFDTILGGKQNTTCFLKENLRGQKFCFENN